MGPRPGAVQDFTSHEQASISLLACSDLQQRCLFIEREKGEDLGLYMSMRQVSQMPPSLIARMHKEKGLGLLMNHASEMTEQTKWGKFVV